MNNRIRTWIPENHIISTQPHLPIPKVQGLFHLELINPSTNEIVEERKFTNLILNRWMDALYDNSVDMQNISTRALATTYLCVGTGSVVGGSAPDFTDLKLKGEILNARTNADGGIAASSSFIHTSSDGPYWKYVKTRLFTETQANGIITEIGWSESPVYNADLNVRASVKDATGSVAPIVKTNEYQLRATYEFRLYPPVSGVTGSIELSGSMYQFRITPVNIQSPNGWGYKAEKMNVLAFDGSNYTEWVANLGFSTMPQSSSTSFLTNGSFSERYTAFPNLATRAIWSGKFVSGTFITGSYVSGSFESDIRFKLEPSQWTHSGSIGGLLITTGRYPFSADYFQYACQIVPPLPKSNLQRLNLYFKTGWGRL